MTRNIDGKPTSDKKHIANALNNFFNGVVDRPLRSLGHTNRQTVPCNSRSGRLQGIPQFKFQSVSEEFTKSELKKLKTNKSCGLDAISPRLLKDSAPIVARLPTCIINKSLATGIVPDDWKCARVTPLFKGGKRCELDNYRPISVLPAASKLLERAVNTQLCTFLTEHSLLSPYQCGFRKNHSTEAMAIALTDYIRLGIDQGLLIGAVFLDLPKAFDTVDHTAILQKLGTYNVRGTELAWFRNYLHSRTQVVTVENEQSERGQITSGVPQGSIIGPLLFVLLMNDLPDCLTTCKTLMYADDTVIYCSSKSVQHIETVLTRELGLINNWLKNNSLFLNKTKTECVLFGSRQRISDVPTFTVSIDGFRIKHVERYTYLGVVLEQTLSWNEHMSHLISKAAKKVGVLGRITQNITTSTANTVYKSFVLPVLEYCNTSVDMLRQSQCQFFREITKESSPNYCEKLK